MLHVSYPVLELRPGSHPLAHLFQLPDPPEALYVMGRPDSHSLLEKLPHRGLAVVGTRDPIPRSTYHMNRWIRELEGADLVIVSGFARGIDAEAHRSAIQAGLPTVGVLGGGIDIPYPRENRELRSELLEAGGLLITEFPKGTIPRPSQFLQRNRLIAAWSTATWVIEAGHRSGALNTAKWARDLGRNCYAVPCFPGDPKLAGNQDLIDRHHAECFWEPSSLGSTWLELSTHSSRNLAPPSRGHPRSDELKLAQSIKSLCQTQGGVEVQALLHETLALGWTPKRFFSALEKALKDRLLLEKNGLLLINHP